VSSGAAAAATAAPSAQEGRSLFVSGISPGQLYSGENMRELMGAIVKAQNDGFKLTLT
jgi:hypothetical protein